MFSQHCVDTMLSLLPEPATDSSTYPGITLIRAESTTECTAIVYQPVFYIVIQGQKQSFLEGESYLYDPGRFLALTVPLPMEGMITRASAQEPYLAMKIDVDSQEGKVTLRGSAPDPAAKERAAEVARGVEQVKSVDNQLTLG